MHTPTGLYVYGGYGEQTIDSPLPAGPDDTSTTWFFQPGIEKKWHPTRQDDHLRRVSP